MDSIELKQKISALMQDKIETGRTNFVTGSTAITEELVGMRIFDSPIMAVGAAHDPVFETLKKEDVIGPWAMSPEEWLPSARSVISFFCPFTERIRQANTLRPKAPADEWLQGRVEGQEFIFDLSQDIRRFLELCGYEAIVPSLDQRFNAERSPRYTSNWSERHTAFICGLGTFGLSRAIITEKGCAGRLGSVVTSVSLPVTIRPYKKLHEYCAKCGACAEVCPVSAFTETGKDNKTCSGYLDFTRAKYAPRYGCGKCMTGVPCEHRNPGKLKYGGK